MLLKLRFSLYSLLLVLTAAAGLLGLVSIYGPYALLFGAGVIVSSFLIAISCEWNIRLFTLGSALCMLFCLWCLCVHNVFETRYCPTCHYASEIESLELFGLSFVLEKQESFSLLTRVAEDMGCSCSHSRLEVNKREDHWGMMFCFNRFSGTSVMNAPSKEADQWYEDIVRPRVRKIPLSNPELAKSFCERVIAQHDEEFWASFAEDALELSKLVDEEKRREETGDRSSSLTR